LRASLSPSSDKPANNEKHNAGPLKPWRKRGLDSFTRRAFFFLVLFHFGGTKKKKNITSITGLGVGIFWFLSLQQEE
jgi:hypothetical protein